MKKVPSETIAGKRVIKRYLGSLKGPARTERAKEVAARREQARAGNYTYSEFQTDKGVETKPSKYTLAYQKRYGKKNGAKK